MGGSAGSNRGEGRRGARHRTPLPQRDGSAEGSSAQSARESSAEASEGRERVGSAVTRVDTSGCAINCRGERRQFPTLHRGLVDLIPDL